MNRIKVSYAPSVRRLPSYLLLAKQANDAGDEYISGTVIANELNLEPIQVRKDLALTGIIGRPKKGYPVEPLIVAIEKYLNWDMDVPAALVGAGNLGTALMGFPAFRQHGLNICQAFDNDLSRIGKVFHNVTVNSMDDFPMIVREKNIEVAVLTVPSSVAQAVSEVLVEAGIKAIWNFSSVKLKLPMDIAVQNEDLSSGYAMLSMKCRIQRERELL